MSHKYRPKSITLITYDPFDDQFLGGAKLMYDPQLALTGFYSRLAKRLLFAARTLIMPSLNRGGRKPRIKVEVIK